MFTTASFSGATAEGPALPAPTPAASTLLLDDLLALAGVDGETGIDAAAVQAMLGAQGARLASPSAAAADGAALLASLAGAASASDAFAAAAGLPAVEPAAHAPAALRVAMVGLYLRHGILPGALDMARLSAATARFEAASPAAAAGLGALVASVNDAIDAVHAADATASARATASLLATIEAVTPSMSASASSSAACPKPPIFADPQNLVVVRGTCDDTDTVHHVLQVDLGGNELYQNRAGGATTLGATEPASISIDLGAGQDTYEDTANYAQGAGLNAVGVLYDDGGDDIYTALMAAQGSATGGYGVGVLADRAGSDNYQGTRRVQGSGDAGYLLDLGHGADTYLAGTASQGGRFVPFPAPTAPAVLFDQGGDDTYTGTGLVQGSGNYLVDASGDDTYSVTGALVPNTSDGFAQGAALGLANGFLIDGAGDDQYLANIYAAQGFGVGNGLGALLDFSGDDRYQASNLGQGVCTGIDGAGGLLFDGSGDDTYTAAAGQGSSRAVCGGYLVDAGGDDAYVSGDGSQGAAWVLLPMQPLLGVLIDASGHDTYTAGEGSQGAGTGIGVGVGILVDADGTDAYTAGAGSQGAGRGAVGILVDGLQDAASITLEPGTVAVASPGDAPPAGPGVKADRLLAGASSQGSGSAGGVGVLVDNDDETIGGGPAHRAAYTAGDNSQGSGSAGGVGVLIDREGRDDYSAGAGSQGTAIDAPLGVLVDLSGRDSYTVPDPAVSRGYGESSTSWAALGLLVDGAEKDAYSGASAGNNACEEKGTTGLTMDADLPFVPVSCLGPAAAAAGSLAGALAAIANNLATTLVATVLAEVQHVMDTVNPVPGGAGPCVGGEYFCDDVEGGDLGYTPNDSLNKWQLVDQATTPSASGTNAQSGTHYWYVGAPYPGVGYVGNEDTYSGGAKLDSPVIDLTTAVAPQFTLSVAGGSEAGFDYLHINIADATGATLATLGSFSGQSPDYQTATFDLSAYAGQMVRVQLSFVSDLSLEDGPGWNVDDLRVAEP
jgi:hypothetical protein